jgi:hypothetical protein
VEKILDLLLQMNARIFMKKMGDFYVVMLASYLLA